LDGSDLQPLEKLLLSSLIFSHHPGLFIKILANHCVFAPNIIWIGTRPDWNRQVERRYRSASYSRL